MYYITSILSLIGGLIIGTAVTYVIFKYIGKKKLMVSEIKAEKILNLAKKEADEIKKEIDSEKASFYREIQEYEKDIRQRRNELNKFESRLIQKEDNLENRLESIEKKEQTLSIRDKELKNRSEILEEQKELIQTKIEAIAGFTKEQAKDYIIEKIKKEAEAEAFKDATKIENEARLIAEKKAKNIIVTSIQRIAPEVIGEVSVSTVSLPSDDMKGRIIGREGRNIRTLENITGVDIIIDDTPEAVVISCFDPIRREIAKLSLEKLIIDGRIHPSRIEEIVDKVALEIEDATLEEGERACMDLGITGLHIELQKYIGKLKYRTSYGQNIYNHSREVAGIAGIMAAEIGADINLCKRCGLLHDIGKAYSDRIGPHAIIGGDLAKRYGENSKIINAISSHHNDIEANSLEAVILQAADAISASRPGARKESFENYIKRLETLEKIASDYDGVEKAYAIQAGREIRIIINQDTLDDISAKKIAKDIAKKIEEEIKYPGQIKVTVIRETRIIEYAK